MEDAADEPDRAGPDWWALQPLKGTAPRTAKGENTSAAWGVVNFLLRLREKLPVLVNALVTVKQFGYKLADGEGT